MSAPVLYFSGALLYAAGSLLYYFVAKGGTK
jgi:hypothetical protein